MLIPSRPRHAAPRVRRNRSVFANPSGRRWRRLRAVGLALAVATVAVTGVVVPRVMAPPALDGAPIPDAPSLAEVGDPPVIGDGPLLRLVRVVPEVGGVRAEDPFDGRTVAELSAEEIEQADAAPYAIQRYGYSQAAHRTISLTFDDGPDPVYTPQLLDLLSRRGVPATFFLTGEQVASHPEIVRRMVREGFAVGNHSLTHVDVTTATSFRQQVELAVTDRILRAHTGRSASYFRLPYGGDDAKSVRRNLEGILRAQQYGYAIASYDFDPQDWAYGDGGRSGEMPMPPVGTEDNITVLLHDAGGADRSHTLAYVDELITRAREAGYSFHSMPQVQPELQARTGTVEPTVWDRVAAGLGTALFVLPRSLMHGLFLIGLFSMLGFGLLNTVLAVIRVRRSRRRTTDERPPVTVLIAAYNEALVIRRTVEHVLASDYPVAEVLVVDDGSTDGTAEVVRRMAAREPRVRLLTQPNGGKWRALNNGFAAVGSPFVVTLDADTLITPTTVGRLMARFHSPLVGAVAGVVKVGNRSRNLVTRWQALEYVIQIGVDRSAAALLDAVMVIPGACAAWRTSAVQEVGGYSGATLAEDCELTLMLHHYGWRVEQADDAIAWTEAPEDVDALLRQRVRWTFGTLQAVWLHRSMLLRPRYGWLGMLVMPMTVVTIALPVIFTPLVAVMVAQMLVQQGVLQVLFYFALFALIYGALAAVGVRLLRESAVHLLVVPVYRLVYEPMRAYLLYACIGTALRGVRLGWNKLARTASVEAVVAQRVPDGRAPTATAVDVVTREPVGVAS